MFKTLFASLLFCLLVSTAFGQQDTQTTNSQYTYQKGVQEQNTTQSGKQQQYDYQRHWSFGGWFGLSFWNGGTDIMIAPKAYYNVSPKFLTGFGITYIYSDSDDDVFSYHSNSIGGSVMVGARPVPMLQLSAEYEGLNTTRSGAFADTYWNNALYLGASFVSGVVSFGVRYDVLYDSTTSAFGSPWSPFIGFYF
ncbi:MAG: hypothetical protein WBV45_13920 [Lutimonas sp.]